MCNLWPSILTKLEVYYLRTLFFQCPRREKISRIIPLFFSIGQGHWSFWMKRICNGQAVFAKATSQNNACVFFYVSNQQIGVICQHYRKIGPEWEFKAGSMICIPWQYKSLTIKLVGSWSIFWQWSWWLFHWTMDLGQIFKNTVIQLQLNPTGLLR